MVRSPSGACNIRGVLRQPGSDHVRATRNLLLGDDPISFVDDTNRLSCETSSAAWLLMAFSLRLRSEDCFSTRSVWKLPLSMQEERPAAADGEFQMGRKRRKPEKIIATLRRLGFRRLSVWPRHPQQDPAAQEIHCRSGQSRAPWTRARKINRTLPHM